jgi:hypothetical protein
MVAPKAKTIQDSLAVAQMQKWKVVEEPNWQQEKQQQPHRSSRREGWTTPTSSTMSTKGSKLLWILDKTIVWMMISLLTVHTRI